MKNNIEEFLDYIQNNKGYSKETIKSYELDLDAFYNFLKSENINSFKSVNYNVLRNYLISLYEKNYSKKTISRNISTLRTFFKYLVSEEIISTNPSTLISNPKLDKRLPNYVTYEELQKLFDSIDNSTVLGKRDLLILELLYSTGIRVSELVNLKLSDINHGEIRVRGKGNKERIVLYGKVCSKRLIDYAKNSRSELCKKIDNQYLILNKNGNKMSTRGVELILENIVRKSGLKIHVTPHTIRHTFATHMLNEGADLKSVQELLGHENLSTTQVYTHISNERLRNVYLNTHPRSKIK